MLNLILASSFGTPLEPVVPSGVDIGSIHSSFNSNPVTPAHPQSPAPDNSTPFTPGMHPTTPGLHPTTPGFQGGYGTPGLQPTTPAPFGVSTPGLLHPTTPGLRPNTPAMHSATPGLHSHNSGLGPSTPGLNPMTPGLIMNPTTPGLNPHTPGYNPTTPGIFGSRVGGIGATPSATTPGMPTGATPAPMTPAAHSSYDHIGGSGTSGEASWISKGVVVKVIAPGEYQNAEGVIISVQNDSCTLDIDGQYATVRIDGLKHVIPQKQDNVKILNGDEAGQTGSLIGVDDSDGIVKMDITAEIKIYPLSHLAKLAS